MGHSAPPSASLYVGDLNPDVNETVLFETFNPVGLVASIRVCRDAVSRRSLGYAYVNYHTLPDAERALETLNFTNIKGRPCRIMWSERDPSRRKNGVGNVFIKNLDTSVDNKQLHDTFSMFGNIVSVKVAADRSGSSLGYGFVHFDSDDSAQRAIEKVNGMMIGSSIVKVEAFKVNSNKSVDPSTAFTNVYVKNIPPSFTQEAMVKLFEQFGELGNSLLRMKDDGSANLGFGFVSFKTHEQAMAAVSALHNTEIDGVTLFVGRAQKKNERERELKAKFEAMREEKAKKYAAGCNLYIKNIDESVTEDMLRQEFSKFGAIVSAKIMLDAVTHRSRGFGFVCFTSAEDATKAVTENNKKMFHGMPLYVGLAMDKNTRRAHLEQQFAQARAKAQMGVGGPMNMMPQYAMYGAQPMYGAPPAGMRAPAGFMGYPQQMMMQQQAAGGARPPMGAQGVQPPRGMAPMGNYGGPAGPRPGMAPYAGMTPYAGQQQPNGPRPQGGRPQGRPMAPAGSSPVAPLPKQPAALPVGDNAFLQALAAATPEQGKTLLGEKLYPLIEQLQPGHAGKITGMLLEMDNQELLHYLDTPSALKAKVAEAMEVLREAGETVA